MYPDLMVVPMREELTRLGVQETRTPEEVDLAISGNKGTLMVVVNSICGCAAGKMRPAVRVALQGAIKPDRSITVFAGQDIAATERAREYFIGQPPSSPSIAILRDGNSPTSCLVRRSKAGTPPALLPRSSRPSSSSASPASFESHPPRKVRAAWRVFIRGEPLYRAWDCISNLVTLWS